ncbi:hypothetical protein CaCOL14_006446 [Colletotrichum acutatum]
MIVEDMHCQHLVWQHIASMKLPRQMRMAPTERERERERQAKQASRPTLRVLNTLEMESPVPAVTSPN